MGIKQVTCNKCGYDVDKNAIMLHPSSEISMLSARDNLPNRFIYRIVCSYCNSEIMAYCLHIGHSASLNIDGGGFSKKGAISKG